ncbi:transposase [[Kitasatospora] papulosa]|uniref:transposase n=1 Tax=[Kitasatospora] papulosa TaxID=1464011 RepID=UPI0037F24322
MAGALAGPRAVPDRLCLQGILYDDMAWQLLPPEPGVGPRQTCWRRLGRWQETGAFDRLHHVLLAELNTAADLDWPRACVDGSRARRLLRGLRQRPQIIDYPAHGRWKTEAGQPTAVGVAASVRDDGRVLTVSLLHRRPEDADGEHLHSVELLFGDVDPSGRQTE